jgi:hypothetical protein
MKNRRPFKESYFTVALPIVLLGLYLIVSGAHRGRQSETVKPIQSPEVLVQKQKNAPLRIVTVNSDSASRSIPHLDLVVMNTSTKPITAYAIRYDVISGKTRTNGAELSVAMLSRSILQPGRSVQTDVGAGENHSDGIDQIVILVDFVEFGDGSTWGPDSHYSAERLAGQRAGAHEAARLLQRILNSKGLRDVVEAVNGETLDIPVPVDRSERWLEGFKTGIGFVQGRIRQAYTEGGITSIESAVRQSVDASEKR